jgi:hypothetical protein
MVSKNSDQVTPKPVISTPPQSEPSWTVQAISRLEVSITGLTHSINTLVSQAEAAERKNEEAARSIIKIEKTIYAAMAVIALLIAVGGFMLNKTVDFGLGVARDAMRIQSPAATTPTPPPVLREKN